MRRYGYLAVAVASVLLTAAATTPAVAAPVAANNVLTHSSLGGPAVAEGAVLSANLASGGAATLYNSTSGTTGLRCTGSNFTAQVVTNPPAPGTATESVTAHTLTNCTVNVIGAIGVRSITVNNLPFNAAVNSDSRTVVVTGGAAGPIRSTAVINTIIGQSTCVYEAQGNRMTGTTSNDGNSITFTNQVFTKVSGPGTCFNTGYFSAVYAPVRDTSAGGALVFVN